MTSALTIRIAAENVADEARALAPHEGRRQPIDADESSLQAWLKNFAALPALEAEDIGAQLHLSLGGDRLAVRWLGGRLGSDKSGTFAAATPAEIVADLLASSRAREKPIVKRETGAAWEAPAAPATDSDAPPIAPVPTRTGSPIALLVTLVAIFAALCTWHFRAETPDGVIWIENTVERDAILTAAAGRYASDTERLTLDAKALLTATDEKGAQTLSTTVRVGRRGATSVLVTTAGVVIDLTANGGVRIGATDYRRLPAAN